LRFFCVVFWYIIATLINNLSVNRIFMSRIIIALLSIVGSVGLYLCLRVLKQYKISTRTQNVIMFIPSSIIFWIWAYLTWEHLWIWRDILALMIPMCVVFSRLPNMLSLQSMQSAPNIWYSLMISKSYVVIAAVVAVPLLWSTLYRTDIVAIAMILWFMSLILIEPQKPSINIQSSSSWIRTALYACIWWAWLALSSSRLIKQWISPLVVNFWIFSIVSIIILIESRITAQSFKLPRTAYLSALWVVIFITLFNRALQKWYATAPNPWYISAANASSIAILTLVSSFIFKDELSLRKIIGIMWVILGIGILMII